METNSIKLGWAITLLGVLLGLIYGSPAGVAFAVASMGAAYFTSSLDAADLSDHRARTPLSLIMVGTAVLSHICWLVAAL